MIWFRDGVVWVPTLKALTEYERELETGSLTLRVDEPSKLPASGSELTFEALVGGRRFAPLRGQVRDVGQGQFVLQLDGLAQQLFLQLSHDGQPGGKRRQRTATGAVPAQHYGAVPPTGSVPTLGSKPFHGTLAGTISVAALADLFDDARVDVPGERAPLTRVFLYLHQQRISGVLTVRSPDYTKRVVFRRGTPVDVAVVPSKESEQLGQILLKAKWITPHRLADVMRRARGHDLSIGEALIQSGLLDKARLDRALSHQTFRRLQDLFSWDGATFEFAPGEQDAGRMQHAVSVPRLMHELAQDLLRQARLNDLQVMLEPFSERYPRLSEDAERVRQLLPDQKTRRVCRQIFVGSRTLRQAITASVLGRSKTVRLVHYLGAARALGLGVDPPRALKSADHLRERVRVLGVQDAFQRLGVPYTVHGDDVAPAYDGRSVDFRPGGDLHALDPIAAAKIVALLDEAKKALSTAALRRKYRERLLGREKMQLFARLAAEEALSAETKGESARARRLEAISEEFR